MDVRSLLNDEDSAATTTRRPSIFRFAPYRKPQLVLSSPDPEHRPAAESSRHQPQQVVAHRPHLPPLQPSRTSSYSSASSAASSSSSTSSSSISPSRPTASHSHSSSFPSVPASSHPSFALHHTRQLPPPGACTESLPSISTRLPSLGRSDSGADSDRAASPLTPDSTPSSTPALVQKSNAYVPASKATSFFGRSLPRPQILSHASSYSSAPSSGPPTSSMDTSFPAAPGNSFVGDMTFSAAPMPVQPLFNAPVPPQMAGGVPPQDEQPNGYSPTSPSAQKPAPKKNSYPCPLARQYHCTEYFTTSGHAARHAKKHTGKKDAVCPECSKAFTRKDNMEQHRRTHSKDSSAQARNGQKSQQSEKDESRQRKMMKLQQHNNKKQRPQSLPTTVSTPSTSSTIPNNNHVSTMASPSVSSTITSPPIDMPAQGSLSMSGPPPLAMDVALDPRLREGPPSAASAPVSAFSPTEFSSPPGFSMPNTPINNFGAAQFSPTFAEQNPQQFQVQQQQLQQQHTPQHHRHSSMGVQSAPAMATPMDTMMMQQNPQRNSVPVTTSYNQSLDFMSPTQLAWGMGIPAAPNVDMVMPGGLNMVMDGNSMPLPLPMHNPTGIASPPLDLQSPSTIVGRAMDGLALDKLAMAASAAEPAGNVP